MFRDAGFHALDVGGSKTSRSSLMLGTTEARTYRSDQGRDGSSHGESSLPRRTLNCCCCYCCCCHIVEVALTQGQYEREGYLKKCTLGASCVDIFVEGGHVAASLATVFALSNPAF